MIDRWLTSGWRRLALAFVLGTALLLATLWMWNLPISLSGENALLKRAYALAASLDIPTTGQVPDSVLLIDVSHDRQLVDVYDDYGFLMGNIDITDRTKLQQLLSIMQRQPDYRYIILDVNFDDTYQTAVDQSLWQTLAMTPRLIIPSHTDTPLTDSRLTSRSGAADYITTIEDDNFGKYPCWLRGRESVVWKCYSEATGADHSSWMGLHWSYGALMRSAFFPYAYFNCQDIYADDGTRQIYHLGADILDYPDAIAEMTRGKYVLIGSFGETDSHQAYSGRMAGVVIQANTLVNLLEGAHRLSWPFLVSLLALYTMLFYIALSPTGVTDALSSPAWLAELAKNSRGWWLVAKLWSLAASLIGYGTVLGLFQTWHFVHHQCIYEMMVLSVVFVAVSRLAKHLARR